ncbi:HAD-IA family hydrolase [Rummeliibacillus pycnus]|uniref:HAD-IA family hydrolase n=1 Tax=Rummeliibacillus pycnus TaxID=101070 RepID=UPI003D2A4154
MIKAVIFDFDGLIFDTETFEFESYQSIYKKYNVEFPLQRWYESIGTNFVFNPYEKLLSSHTYLDENEIKKERTTIFEDSIQEKSPREGVINYFEKAKELGLMVALASSSTKNWIYKFLEMLNLEKFFDLILTADDVSEVKPNPELYLRVLEHFEIQANEAVVFEDSPNGSLAAIRANIPCVVVPNATTQNLDFDHQVALRINSMAEIELSELLQKLSLKQI